MNKTLTKFNIIAIFINRNHALYLCNTRKGETYVIC